MRIKRIALYEVQSNKFHIYKSRYAYTPRLGLCVIASELKRAFPAIDTRVLIGEAAPATLPVALARKLLRRPERHETFYRDLLAADIVGVSALTMNINEAYALSRRLRADGFTGKLVIGGPHVTFNPSEPFRHGYDYVIRYAGEKPMARLVTALRDARGKAELGRRLRAIRGLSYRLGRRLSHNEDAEMKPRTLEWGQLDYRNFEGLGNVVPLATSISCPHRCSFCSVVRQWGDYKERPLEEVIAEWRQIRQLRREGKISRNATIFITDDNFLPYPNKKERAIELMNRLIAEGLNEVTWRVQVTANTGLDEDFVRLMKRAGCTWVFIGFESLDPGALKEMHKAATVSVNLEGARNFRRAGINVHGMFVSGFDSDTPSTIQENLKFALRNVDTAQFMILTPLLGTPLYEEYKRRRIVDRDWSHYDAHHITYNLKNFQRHELFDQVCASYKRFYSLRSLLRAALVPRNWFNQYLLLKLWGYLKVREWHFKSNRHYRQQLRLEQLQEDIRRSFRAGYGRYKRIAAAYFRRLGHRWDGRVSTARRLLAETQEKSGRLYAAYRRSLGAHLQKWQGDMEAAYRKRSSLGRKKKRRATAFYQMYLGRMRRECGPLTGGKQWTRKRTTGA